MVRLSGPRCFDVLARCVDSGRAADLGDGRRVAGRARLTLPTSVAGSPPASLPVLLLSYRGPHSYTGEDSAELIVPGNSTLVARVLDRLVAAGETDAGAGRVRRAGPGEFSARAYVNGRLTLSQAEGVAALIAAHTASELEGARRMLSGETGVAYSAITDECATLLALVEAGIDFTDQEDVTAIAPIDLDRRVRGLRDRIAGVLGVANASEVRSSLPRVALVGPPNAGKSTLFNWLLGRPRAVAAPNAGTTRDVLAETVEIDSPEGVARIVLEDLPGLDAGLDLGGDARGDGGSEREGLPDQGDAEAQAAAQRAAAAAIERADVLLWCHPEGTGPSAEPLRQGADRRWPSVHVVVRTFGDRPAPPGAALDAIPVCGLDGWNVAALRAAIVRSVAGVGGGSSGAGEAAVLPRHRDALCGAFEVLGTVVELVERDRAAGWYANPELVARGLREALDELGQLTGRIDPDAVLGRIFASFCIGK